MNYKIKLFTSVISLGIIGMLGYYFANSYIEGNKKVITSDAKDIKEHINIGVDNWIGYFPLCSPNLKKRMLSTGYLLQCEDDQANYSERFKNLKRRKYDFAVSTVDAYLRTGKDTDYPGVIISVIDESKGGDAIIANGEKITSIDQLKNGDFKIAFTPDSPSEFLLKSVAVHFDIENLLKNKKWKLESDGASDALNKLNSGTADVAVVWEPEVTRALNNKKFKKLLSSSDTSQLIVDVLLVNRDFATEKPEIVKLLMANYFRTLKYYRENPAELFKDVEGKTGISQKEIEAMLKGVSMQTLSDNARRWYGITPDGQESLSNTIEGVIEIFKSAGDMNTHPLPNSNPYVIQNRKFIEQLHESGIGESEVITNEDIHFETLAPEDWEKLVEIGTLKVRPITFQSSSNSLTDEGITELTKAAESLQHFPNFRVVIKGHTGVKGDEVENKNLSRQRANTVKDYLVNALKVDENRLRTIGFGSSKPLSRQTGESDREYNYKLPRVELYLVSEVY